MEDEEDAKCDVDEDDAPEVAALLELAALLATAVLEMAAVLGAVAFSSTFDGSTNAHVVPPASLRTRRNNFDDPATTIADMVARPPTVFGIALTTNRGAWCERVCECNVQSLAE